MLANKALSLMISAQNMKQVDIARAVGKPPQFVNDSLRRDMRVSTFARFADAAGCELVLRKAGERDGIVITAED